MTAEYPHGDEPLIPMPALSLPALRQAVATVAPSRLPEFFQEIQDAFTQAGDEDSVSPSATSTSAGAPPSPSSGGPRSPPGSTPPNEPSPTLTPLSGTRQFGKPPRSSRRPTARSRVPDWHWEPVTDDLLDGLSPAALAAVRQVAEELAVRESMIFLDGREFTGEPPGLRTIQRGPLMLVYLTDVRGERVVIIQVNWIG